MKGNSLTEYATARIKTLRAADLYRSVRSHLRENAHTIVQDGRTLMSFACNDYLGLSQHPTVVAASIAAIQRSGVGARASRLISGNHGEYAALELALAELKGTEDAIVFGSGYLANIGIVPALVGARDLVCFDEHAHSSLLAGAALSRAEQLSFGHNDAQSLSALLERERDKYRHCLVLTEGVFSMDGDLAPLGSLAAICETFDAWLLVDDAHALGVVGDGRGSAFTTSPPVAVPLQMGTLSKAAGAYGGYVCSTQIVCDFLRNRARSFIYSTGLPPGTVAAATAALALIRSNPDLTRLPLARAQQFTTALDLPPAQSAIVPLVVGSPARALAASRQLSERGIFVPAIRPPTVPRGTARLRFAFSALHTEADVARLATHVKDIMA